MIDRSSIDGSSFAFAVRSRRDPVNRATGEIWIATRNKLDSGAESDEKNAQKAAC